MKYLKIFEDFERSAYTKISPKTLIKGNEYLQEKYPFLNIDLFKYVDCTDVIPGGNLLCYEEEYDSIESLIEEIHDTYINAWDYRKYNYTINNGLLDIDGNVNLGYKGLLKIPYKFGKVAGFFSCRGNKLTSLKGAPETVSSFYCDGNQLVSLSFSPKIVNGEYDCSRNKLITLEGAPESVELSFDCHDNQLKTLKGAPKLVGGNFIAFSNQLVTLEGSPDIVEGNFDVRFNNLTNVKYLPKGKVGGAALLIHNPELRDFTGYPNHLKNHLNDKYRYYL